MLGRNLGWQYPPTGTSASVCRTQKTPTKLKCKYCVINQSICGYTAEWECRHDLQSSKEDQSKRICIGGAVDVTEM